MSDFFYFLLVSLSISSFPIESQSDFFDENYVKKPYKSSFSIFSFSSLYHNTLISTIVPLSLFSFSFFYLSSFFYSDFSLPSFDLATEIVRQDEISHRILLLEKFISSHREIVEQLAINHHLNLNPPPPLPAPLLPPPVPFLLPSQTAPTVFFSNHNNFVSTITFYTVPLIR